MKIIWKAVDDAPPPKAAIEWGVRAMAERAGMVVPDDSTILIDGEFVLGSYPLVVAAGPDDELCWFVDYDRLLDELASRTDAEMRAAGEDPTEGSLERQIYRLLRRKLIHWPEDQVRELRGVILPIINEVVHELTHDHEGHDHG